jgi:catechol 2,3-dioxygenase-like lactoylglutathione lyase family enzyme
MIKRFHHAGVGVRDPEMMEKMLHFYRDLLGLSVQNEIEYPEGEFVDSFVDVKDAKLKVVHLTCPGADNWLDGGVELCYYASPEPLEWHGGIRQSEGGVVHLALVVENLMEMHKRLVKEGVKFNTPPLNLGDGIIVYMHDPDGNTVELMEPLE